MPRDRSPLSASTAWLQREIVAPLLAAALVLGLLSSQAAARRSDPVRNLNPEEPVAPGDVHQDPIFYILPAAAVADVNAPAPETLLQEFMDRHTSMNYPAAAEAALRLINAVPGRAVGYYNLARAMARMQRLDEAFDALHKAVEHGWRDVVHTNIDPDLANLRADKRFAQTVDDLKAKIDAERIAPAPLRNDESEKIAADLAREAPPLLARYDVPGASVALIRDGKVVWTGSFGKRDARKEDALIADDLFRLRAPLHLLTIAACQQLEDQQKLQLSRLIVQAANDHALAPAARPPAHSSATAGQPIARPANIRDGQRPALANGGAQAANVRTHLRSYTRDSVYGFLRLAVEQAAEESFPRYCESSILQRLDLRHTGFAQPENAEHVATGHSFLGTPLRPAAMQNEFAPGGCVYMSAGDLARLITSTLPAEKSAAAPANAATQVFALPNDDADGHAQPAAVDDAAAARLARALDMITQTDAALNGSLGLALQRVEDKDGVRYQLDESAGGIVCLARWRPATRSGIVILCNAATAREAAERIAHIALGGE